MKAKWTEQISASRLEMIWSLYPEAEGSDFDKHYEGEVIGNNKSFWGNTYFLVLCTDGKIREVDINNVKIIPNESKNSKGIL